MIYSIRYVYGGHYPWIYLYHRTCISKVSKLSRSTRREYCYYQRFRGFGRDSSSVSSSPADGVRVSGTRKLISIVRDGKRVVTSSLGGLKEETVWRDHGPVGSTDAFFKDSMSRDAMIGVRFVTAL